ncbi:hypothetical protein PHLCEN_2v8397 [Hermanssonia centrifuga]|uniref:Uncharacterized protein n=1 Tax=Hermanssonia centrifuga TaxID=98765 RepID=A0A2R6NTP2_9APHY|nr:hypothetical protein PHLCEN_2v8397 [Hermanssonia centrifuga]
MSSQVCQLLKNVIDTSTDLQFQIECAVTRIKDGSSAHLSVAERFKRLRDSQDAWRSMRKTAESSVPVHDLEEARGVQVSGSLLGQLGNHNSLLFNQLPSSIRGIPSKEWEIAGFEFAVNDFAIDQCQDLLIVVEETYGFTSYNATSVNQRTCRVTVDLVKQCPNWWLHLHFVTISTGEKHLLAAVPKVTADIEARELSRYKPFET